jgi:hypothetical protein
MTTNDIHGGGQPTLEELPDSVAGLTVSGSLIEAGITGEEISLLDYIVDQVYFYGEERGERSSRSSLEPSPPTRVTT